MARQSKSNANHVTLAQVLSECENKQSWVHKLPERADWFATMLRNAIANERQKIDCLAHYPEYNLEHHYNCIARCEAGLWRIGR